MMTTLPQARKNSVTIDWRNISLLFVLTLFFLLFGFAGPSFSGASERIVDFNSQIRVDPDGSMTVEEMIRVICEGNQIKRGIFREFPTKYKDRYGNTVKVRFEVIEVIRDGRPEPYHIQEVSKGKRVYIGQKNVLLRPGTYAYTIIYKTDRQLGFFKDFDELYWNVTGNNWNFVIDHARAVVLLPFGAKILDIAAYTGRLGEKGKAFTTGFDKNGNVTFATTRRLLPGEGLTIAVAWPKGMVAEPTSLEKAGHILRDNRGVVVGLIGLVVVLIYYLWAWFRVGRDPAKGTIIPLFSPPKRFSPAAVRFVIRMGFDDKSFAAAVVNMAVKGFLTIKEDEGVFTLAKTGSSKSDLSRGEKRVMHRLFRSRGTIELKNTNHEEIQEGISALKKSLKMHFEKIYFFRNSKYLLPGVILTLLTLGALILTAIDVSKALFMTVWLSIWTTGCFFLVLAAAMAWRDVLRREGGGGAALGITLFALPFLAGEILGLWFFSSSVSPLAVLALVAVILVNGLFYHLLKAPTLSGRKIMDEIEGFRLYLSVAEQERLNVLNPPDKTPELFERYLPYALALDVENEWGEQFADVLAVATVGGGYQPAWYSGTSWSRMGVSSLASNLGNSFSGAISSASSPPGSSSGSGGGGSSGGGGGGGGGGGW
jgi:uncharacterized membrane protein YgcG